MAPFALLTTFFSSGAIISFIKKFYKSDGNTRRQVGFVMIGIITMLGLIISTIMIPVLVVHNDFFVQFAPLYALIFLGMTAVAVLRYHLFDIKLIVTETLVIILILALLFEGLTEGSLFKIILKISFSILVGFLGLLLIRSVKKEITQREQLGILNTTLEKTNANLKTANLQLQQLDQQKTDFLSIASHQMRTPLSIFNGYMELLEDGAYGKTSKPMLEVFKNIEENNQHLVKLVDEFLDITRIEQHRTKFTFVSLDIVAMISNVVKELTLKLRGKKLIIEWKPPLKPIMVQMDEEKIRHVIFNLIDNAIKYTEQGTITVLCTPRDKGVEVIVRDTGLGFDEHDQANFFQKFYRGNNVRGINVTGTGLGLFVASKFIDGHSGKIWAKSPGLNKGGEFGFWIPLSPPPVPVEDTGEQSVVVSYSSP
jgi:signal transduction histidine kinase